MNKISQPDKLDIQYLDLLKKVKERFRVRDAKHIGISESKASRVLNGIQKDLHTLSKMAAFINIEIDLIFKTIQNET